MTPCETANKSIEHFVASTRGRRTASAIVAVAISLIGLAGLAGTAWAGEAHVPAGFIGEPGAGNGQLHLAEHSGVVVDTATSDVYVSDTGNHRIEQFEPDGTFVRTFAPAGVLGFAPTFLAIDNSGGSDEGDLYVMDSSGPAIYKFEADGTQVTNWGVGGKLAVAKPQPIAVGPDGDLFAGDGESIVRYGASGTELSSIHSNMPVEAGLAADSEGNLYLAKSGLFSGFAEKLSLSGDRLGERYVSQITAVAVDPENDELYLAGEGPPEPLYIRSYSADCGTSCTAPDARDQFGRGELSNPQGIGVGPDHIVYVSDAGTSTIAIYSVEIVEPPLLIPPLEVDQITDRSAHVSGLINPGAPSGDPPTYKVHWQFACFRFHMVGPSGHEVEEAVEFNCGNSGREGELAPGSTEDSVEGVLTNLAPLTKYEVRLKATNRGGTAVEGETFTTAAAPPSVDEVFASDISTTSATLNASGLNPGGADTTYYFEYATEAEGLEGPGAKTTVPVVLPGNPVDHEVSQVVSGLQINTAYVYRLVASNSTGPLVGAGEERFRTQVGSPPLSGGCTNESFRGSFGALLPDCRAYEQASPVDKAGLNVEGWPGLLVAAADDEPGEEPGVTFYNQAGSGIPAGGGAHQELVTMLASRVDDGWSLQRLLPPESLGSSAVYLGSSANLRYALVTAVATKGRVSTKLLRIDSATGSVVQVAEAPGTEALGNFASDSIASDGSSVLFESQALISTGVPGIAGKSNLYRWSAATGQVSLVGIRPTGAGEKEKSLPKGSFGGPYAWKATNANAGGTSAGLYVEAVHAATPDGGQIYLTAGETGQIYLRKGLDGGHPTTVQVSKPAPGAPTGEKEFPAAFLEATPDGSYAFFSSAQKLTGDASTGAGNQGSDLYRFDAATETLVDITPDAPEEANGGARVQGLLGSSSAGTSGYFAAKGVLANGATAGSTNIYRFKEEDGHMGVSFIVTLGEATAESLNWSPESYSGSVIANFEGKAARVSSDGSTLIFTSKKAITGFDNNGCGFSRTEPCSEIFMFTTGINEVICLSCDPTGARAIGDAELTGEAVNAHLVPKVAPAPTLTRNLSANGDRVFFETPDPLVAADTNSSPTCSFGVHANGLRSDPLCLDVYEWEAAGAPGGSCTRAEVNGGCLYLLSTGKSQDPSYFMDASADGADVFIATTAQLTPVDKDENYDAYDVRVDGGLASQQVVPGTPCASDEGCRGAPGVASPPGSASSATFQGPGNPKATKPKPCKKGYARKHGKCVKKKQGKKTKNKHGKRKQKKSHRSSASKGDRK
jgi:hypothetical protein